MFWTTNLPLTLSLGTLAGKLPLRQLGSLRSRLSLAAVSVPHTLGRFPVSYVHLTAAIPDVGLGARLDNDRGNRSLQASDTVGCLLE